MGVFLSRQLVLSLVLEFCSHVFSLQLSRAPQGATVGPPVLLNPGLCASTLATFRGSASYHNYALLPLVFHFSKLQRNHRRADEGKTFTWLVLYVIFKVKRLRRIASVDGGIILLYLFYFVRAASVLYKHTLFVIRSSWTTHLQLLSI